MNNITKNQKEIAKILLKCKEDGFIPTNRELAKLTKKSFQYVNYALHRLEEKGLIQILPNKKRNIRLLYDSKAHLEEINIIKTIFKYLNIKPTPNNIEFVGEHLNGLLVTHIYKENFKKIEK
jgi:SOS-response transcriptional repressor LexA